MREQTIALADTLEEQVNRAKTIMSENGYSQKTVGNYGYVWNQLTAFAHSNGMRTYSEELLTSFAQEHYGVTDVFHPNTDKEKYYARMLLCLDNVVNGKPWASTHKRHSSSKKFHSPALEDAYYYFTNWLESKNLKQGSIDLKQQQLRDFLNYTESEGIRDISELSVKTLSGYLMSRNALSTSTKSGIITTIREFLRTPEISAQTLCDLSTNLRASNNGRYEKLPSTYSTGEIRCLLSCIDRTTREGKKDYAFIILAADAGMRTSEAYVKQKLNTCSTF